MEQLIRQKEILNPFTGISPLSYFYLSNGQIIKNIKELPSALENINDATFSNHVSPYKNDFAKWVYDVYKEEKLSRLLGEIKSKEELIRIMRAYLKQQEKTDEPIVNEEKHTQEEIKKEEKNIIKNAQEQIMINPVSFSPNNINDSPDKIEKKDNQTTETIKRTEPMQNTKRIYVWKTGESEEFVLKPKPYLEKSKEEKREVQQDIKSIKNEIVEKPETKKEAFFDKLSKNKTFSSVHDSSINKGKDSKQDNLTKPLDKLNPDEFFEKNPVLISQAIEAKKKVLEIERLEPIFYPSNKIKKEIIDILKDAYSKAYQRLSFLRKAGFDTLLAEMMLARIPAKINLYDASDENKDEIIARRYINEVIEELNNLKH